MSIPSSMRGVNELAALVHQVQCLREELEEIDFALTERGVDLSAEFRAAIDILDAIAQDPRLTNETAE